MHPACRQREGEDGKRPREPERENEAQLARAMQESRHGHRQHKIDDGRDAKENRPSWPRRLNPGQVRVASPR